MLYTGLLSACLSLLSLRHNVTRGLSTLIAVIALVPALLLPFEQMAWAVTSFQQSGFKHTDSAEKTNAKQHPTKLSDNRQLHAWQSLQQRTPKTLSSSSSGGLPVMANGQSALVSNAENFHGAWNASVDPRTGNASFSLTVESVLFNHGEGRHDLQLSYAGGPSPKGPDSFDLGVHWQWNTGREYPSPSEVEGHLTTDIITGDGHRFTMVSDRNALGKTIWHPLRHKLGDVLITGHPGDWMIATATGIRQHIYKGYEDWEENRSGQRIYFYYDREEPRNKTRHLTWMCSHQLSLKEQKSTGNLCGNEGVRLTYRGRDVIIDGYRRVIIHRNEINGLHLINQISLPSLSSSESERPGATDSIFFNYDVQGRRPWLLRQITYPTGLQKTFLYNGEADYSKSQTRGLPVGVNDAHLPVVTEEITSSSKANGTITPIRVWYNYGSADNGQGEHNYLGYQGSHSVQPGKDNLFDRPGSYTYSVTRDDGTTMITTTYNKYHLPLSVRQYDSQSKSLLALSEQHYPSWRQTTFSQLPANYSLAKSKNQTLYALSEKGQERTIVPARVMQSSEYNSNGQIIWQKDPYGRIKMTQYCPPAGNSHCPPADSIWPQVTKPEKILILPATQSPTGSRPFITMSKTEITTEAREIVFDYMRLPAVAHKSSAGHGAGNLSFFWQVRRKTSGTVPVAQVADLKPGDTLPELKPEQLSSQTLYEYNTETGGSTYGKMTRLTLINFPEAAPVSVQGTLLLPARAAALAAPAEKASFNIDNQIDSMTNTRTTTVSVAPTMQTTKNTSTMAEKAGMQLGTTVYSLKTGNKLASHDTLKTMATSWKYDPWNRPLMRVESPVNGGYPRKTRWTYIASPRENAIIKTLPEGEQIKTVLNVMGQEISTSHRFPVSTDTSKTGWVPDTETTYTSFGKVHTRVKWHADDPASDGVAGKAIALKTTYGYDVLNRQTWVHSPDGQINFTIRDDPHMLILTYRTSVEFGTHKEITDQMLKVVQSNILGKPVAMYLLPLNQNIKKRGNYLYSLELKQELQQLLSQQTPASQLQSQRSYGLLPVTGLLTFVQKALAQHAWLTHTTWSYDGHGRKVSQKAGNGVVTHWFYEYDHLVATTTADGRIIHDTFNVRGDKTARCVQPAGIQMCHVTGTRSYDARGNIRWEADAYGQKILYEHDANGRLLKMVTPADSDTSHEHIFTWQYNSLGLTAKILDGRIQARYRYDPVTWKLTDSDDAISHTHYTYAPDTGALQNVTHSTPDKNSSIAPVPGIHYPGGTEMVKLDRYLQIVSMTDMAGNTYTTIHDKLGRSIETHVMLPHTTAPVLLTKTSYDAFGRPSVITNGIQMHRQFTYDILGQIISTHDYHQGTLIQTLAYTYDPETHNMLTFTRAAGSQSATQTYHYDRQNNLDEMHCTTTNTRKPSDLCPRDTDIGHSQFTTPPIITGQRYSFDRWNNIQTVEETGVAGTQDAGTYIKKTTYTYAGAGQSARTSDNYDPHRLTNYQTRWSNQLYSASPEKITCDKQGRIIRDADGNQLHYDASGQQDRFINVHTHEVTHYTYDSDGHMVAAQPFDSANHLLQAPLYMLYKGDAVVAEIQESNHQQHINVELGGVAHSENGQITRWYLRDYKGDLLTAFNAEGVKTAENLYSPYGMKYNRISTKTQVFSRALAQTTQQQWWKNHLPGFNNQMSDPATGYQFLGGGYRAYNPVYRRFMKRDSFSPFKEIDGYGFGQNNPIMNTDPSGHMHKELGYLSGILGIGMAVMMTALIPVTAAGLAVPASVAFAAFSSSLLTLPANVANIASGSLQIAATAHPEKKDLQLANLLMGIGAIFAGTYTGLYTTKMSINALRSIMRSGNGLIQKRKNIFYNFGTAAAGITALASHAAATLNVIPGSALVHHPEQDEKNGWLKTQKILMMVSIGSMAISILSGVLVLSARGIAAECLSRRSGAGQSQINTEEHASLAGKSKATAFPAKELKTTTPTGAKSTPLLSSRPGEEGVHFAAPEDTLQTGKEPTEYGSSINESGEEDNSTMPGNVYEELPT